MQGLLLPVISKNLNLIFYKFSRILEAKFKKMKTRSPLFLNVGWRTLSCVFSKFFDRDRHNLNRMKLTQEEDMFFFLGKNLGMTIVALQLSEPNTEAMA
jgi:hypothetical protein